MFRSRLAVHIALGLILLDLAACSREAPVQVAESVVGRFGTVKVYHGGAPRTAVVFVFSDTAGWSAPYDRAARSLAARATVVVGVDLHAYLGGLAASDDGCHYLLSEIEELSKQVQRSYGFEGYASPILIGVGAGGTLAYAALAQSPAATVAGAISIHPTAALATRVPLCPGARATAHRGGGFRYAAHRPLPGWWRLVDAPEGALAHVATATGATVIDRPAGSDVATDIAEAAAAVIAPQTATARTLQLPLVELPTPTHKHVMAVIYSGDGGWRDLDKQVAEVLVTEGVPVIGVDCLRYFWKRRDPDEIARDLSDILRTYRERWQTPRVVLVGYSFGADILPFAFNRLSSEEQARVVQISMLGPSATASFQFHVTDWLGVSSDTDEVATLPELHRIDPRLLQCVFGEDEEDSACPGLQADGVETLETKGGHHFDGNYRRLAGLILAGVDRRTRPPAP